jgi:hypothetical protein
MAWLLLAEQRAKDPDRRLSGIRRDYDFTLLGGLLGTLCGLLRLFLFRQASGLILCMFSGIVVGLVADTIARKCRFAGHFRWDIADLLFVTAATAVVLALWMAAA